MEDPDRFAVIKTEFLLLPKTVENGPIAVERRQQIPPNVARNLLHELRVHQAELEAQNEELRCTKLELDAARARYFDLYDLAPVGYCTVSDTEKILNANLTATQLLGIPCGSLIGRPIQQFIAPVDQDIYYLHCKRLFETGHPQSCELRMLRPDRSHFWARLMATFDHGTTGQSTHRIVLTDVHERKLAEDKIRISDLALKAVSQGILITTPDLRVVSANEAFLSMTGYSAQELAGVNYSILNGPLTDAATIENCLNAIATKKEFAGEAIHYRKNGTWFWNALTFSPVFDDASNLTHFICISTDISERKRMDQALQDNNYALERATSVAEKANLAKSDFLSSMSHELRSPLNSILGFAQLLATGTPVPTPLQHKNIDKILRGGWYLLTLINDILDLALIESGKLALAMEPLSLTQVLIDCKNMVESQAENRGIKISFPETAKQFLVAADPIRLTQVIVNLLSNAIKYNSPNGSVQVTVSPREQGTVRISVQDSGPGLPGEKLSQLFQPFNRLGQESSNTDGTGIGLVVTRKLIELMGGTIGVLSTVGVGSVFWVELKAAKPALLKGNVVTYAGQQNLNIDPLGDKPSIILYVEDNSANVDLVTQILDGRPNLRLLIAQNGMQGVEMARIHKPQVILMDINLPGMSGLDALKMLQQDITTKHIPVLAITANALPLDEAKGMAAGFFQYVTKPFRINKFMQSIDLAVKASIQHSELD